MYSESFLCLHAIFMYLLRLTEESPRPVPTGEKRRQEEDTEHTEEEQGEAVGHALVLIVSVM